jgi:EEF1A N-terminal glycine/lysine methyltransferase
MSDDENDSAGAFDLFQEPADYLQKEKPSTVDYYTMRSGCLMELRLIGHSPLWVGYTRMWWTDADASMQGHLLWNAGQVIAGYLEDNSAKLVENKSVLELGAGAGLPSLVAATLGARLVVVSDYPDQPLIANLQYNIDNCSLLHDKSNIVAEGYLWGSSTQNLTKHLHSAKEGFDLLILADILFNHSEHWKLLLTVRECLKKSAESVALVFFTPYRPWLLDKDLAFFDLAREADLLVDKICEQVMDKVMFENDRGDETLRKTVYGFQLKWKP